MGDATEKKPDNNPATVNKRKRNRKKKPKNKSSASEKANSGGSSSSNNAAEEERSAGIPAVTEESKMNPHLKLRNALLSGGFTGEEIDKATEEMWNKSLAYDEYDSVFKYLKTGGKEEKKSSKETNKQEAKTVVGKSTVGGGIEESKEGTEPPSATQQQQAPAPKSAPAPPMTMAAKLNMVAEFENLTDAVFALTEWVNKVAKPIELSEVCAAQTTSALPTIFRRSITECEDQSRFDSAVLPAMTRLMTSLLSKCGINNNSTGGGVAETEASFGTLLKQARRTFLLQENDDDDEVFANQVARFVVSRISLAVEEFKGVPAKSKAMNGESSSMMTTSSLLSSHHNSKNSDRGFSELLSKRDANRMAAKRSSVMARSACDTVTEESAPLSNGTTITREPDGMDKADILSAIVGKDAKSTFVEQKAKLEKLKAQVKQGDSNHLQTLRTTANDLQSKRDDIAKSIDELKESMKKLEAQDIEISAKVASIEVKIEAECKTDSAETNQLNEQVKEASKAVQYGKSVGTLVDVLKTYDASLDKATNSSSVQSLSEEDGDSSEVAYQTMDVFLTTARIYYASEAQCVEFLRRRIDESQQEAGELKTEIAECEGLGMTTTIGQMEETQKEKEDLIVKDTALIERLAQEAKSMFSSLISRLEHYNAAQASDGLPPIHSGSLNSIHTYVSMLGLDNEDRLMPYIAVNGHSASPRSTDPPAVPNSGTKVAPIGTPKAQKEKFFDKAPAVSSMPKFTWATASKPAETAHKPSLLDIQNEELKSKSGI